MTKVVDLNTELTIPKRAINEPIGAQELLSGQLSRFPEEVYNLTVDSHLWRLINSIAGEVGAGSLKKELLLPKLQQMLDSTHFKDLDLLYGNPLGLPRLNLEVYDFDPQSDALTQVQWQEVRAKDADYRSRCLKWMRAILHGATIEGISLAAEAAIGVECDVFERTSYLDNLNSDQPTNLFAYYDFENTPEWATTILSHNGEPPHEAWDYTLSGGAVAPTFGSGGGAVGSRYVSAVSDGVSTKSVEIHTNDFLRIDITQPYTYSAFWRRSSGTGDPKALMQIACYDESGNKLGIVYPTNAVSGVLTPTGGLVNPNSGVSSTTWERWGGYVASSQWFANTAKILLEIYPYWVNSAAGTILVDAVQFEQGTNATGFGLKIPGITFANSEVVIIPQVPDVTQQEQRAIMRLVDRLRPVDIVPTLASGDRIRADRPAVATSASSSQFNVQRLVTARSDIDWQEVDAAAGFWLIPGVETEAPTFAWIDRQEIATFPSIATVTASSTKVGNFNLQQRQLFPQLASVTDPFDEHDASRSYAKSFAQLNFTIPWVNNT